MLPPSLENVDLRVAHARSGASGVHGLGVAAVRIGQVELAVVAVEQPSPVGRPAPDRPGRSDHRETARALPARRIRRSRLESVGHVGRLPRQPCAPSRQFGCTRSIRRAGRFGVGIGVSDAGDVGGTRRRRSARASRPAVGRMIPEPAASAPPTIRTAATARSVNPRRRLARRSGIGVVAGIVARLSRRSSGAVSVSPTSAAYHARRRPSSSRSVIGLSLCRPHRSRRAGASVRNGVVTGPSPAGRRDAVRSRRRAGRGSSAARRRPGGRATAPRSRRR